MDTKYINGYLNYTGSKYNLLEQILPEMDYEKKYFIDLFSGSFVVGANVIHEYDKVLANDIIEDVIGIHKAVIESDDIIEEVKILSNVKEDQEGYNKLRKDYNESPTPGKLWALILSCNSNLMRFNKQGKFNQTWGRRQFNNNTQKKIDLFINEVRPYKDKIIFTSKHFEKIIVKKPAMIYIDPPYGYCEDVNGNITNNQISEAGYNATYTQSDDIKLYNYCKKLDEDGSSFMLSGLLEHDNKKSWLLSQLIRDGFKYKELEFNYNKVSKKGKKESKEIIITNYG